MMKGHIFEIAQYMTEDGPGIRTVVFFKGCPLRCKWCSNPYGLQKEKQLSVNHIRCSNCGSCVEACGSRAITRTQGCVTTDFGQCIGCGACLSRCSNGARNLIGIETSVEEIISEIESSRMYYRHGEGGVTISGGEVLLQHEFAAELLRECGRRMVSTAIETSGFGQWEHLNQLIGLCDYIFIDLKHMDSNIHKELTGADNEQILTNIEKTANVCASTRRTLIVRMPLIPKINDSKENLLKTAEFVGQLSGNVELNLLPYHNLGAQKYAFIGKDYPLIELEPLKNAELDWVRELLNQSGINYSIGGGNVQSY